MAVDLKDLKDKCKNAADVNLDCDFIGLYFSAHWCPPCRGFTPVLAQYYKDWRDSQSDKKFEVVFVSSDQEQGAFDDYFGEMPWVALEFSDRGKKEELSKKFDVRGIPTLIILDRDGNVVSGNGRGQVMSNRENGKYDFTKDDDKK